jgi:RraA family protein
MNFEEARNRLAALDTASLCDADRGIRVMDPEIRPLRPDLRLTGRAHTVSCRDDFLTVIKGLRDAEPGEVLVVDGQGGGRALAGELFATEALRKGLAGIIIDGGVRDTHTLRKLDLPVYARFIHPNAGTTDRLFATQVPVTCGGVTVAPGDIVFGDRDGVVVMADPKLRELILKAELVQRAELEVLGRMGEGIALTGLLNLDEHLGRVAAGEKSRLRFVL